MPFKTTLMAMALAAMRLTVAAPFCPEARDMEICSAGVSLTNCADENGGCGIEYLKCQDRPFTMCVGARETPIFCREGHYCVADMVCVDKELSDTGTFESVCVPRRDACKSNSDCEGKASCVKKAIKPEPEFGTCATPLPGGQCRTNADCPGDAACAFKMVYPKPEFGNCVGRSSDKNNEGKSTRVVSCTGDYMCAGVNDQTFV